MRTRALTAVALLGVTALAGTGAQVVRQAQAQQEPAPPPAQVARAGASATPASLSAAFRRAAEQALPGVVHVQVEGTRVARNMFGEGQAQKVAGSGSGFIIRPDGYILTNNHVIAGAERVRVVMQTRQEYTARVVGRDPNTDLAVLKIDAKDLPVVRFTDSDAAAVGDWVVALGYPLQLGVTATAGIVSAKGRALGIIDASEEAPAPLEHFIQTDAAINPGNSGGPLVDLEGRVVGVNSAIKSQTGYYSGYGFAIPANLARRVSDDLIAHGAVRRPMIGVQLDDVDPVDADVYKLTRVAGAEVRRVTSGSPADRAGIRMGDVITAVNGRDIEWSSDLMERLALLQPGSTVNFDIVRYGQRQQVAVKMGEFELPRVASAPAERASSQGGPLLGFAATDLTPSLARRLRVQATDGVVITGVASTAAQAGLAAGLLLESINGQKVHDVRDVEQAAARLRPGSPVSLVVRLPDGGDPLIVNYRAQT